MKLLVKWLVFCLSLTLSAKALCTLPWLSAGTIYQYEIIAEREHNSRFFTQGLEIHQGYFYESSGLYNQSFITRYPVQNSDSDSNASGNAQAAPATPARPLAARYFAEGLTLLNNSLYVLTWREQTLHIYKPETLELKQTLRYSGQGWGLTNDGEQLIRSDGSHKLYFHSPENFVLRRTVEVYRNMEVVERLNELEYVNGKIWANIWYENTLVEIDPKSGRVTGQVDLTDLVNSLALSSSEQVLNGIAYDSEREAFWITGKLWPKMFLIRLKSSGD